MDSGANGGMAGPDTRLLSVVPNAHVDITGISGEPIEKLQLVQCAAAVETLDEGMIILIMSQYAHAPNGKTIHSKSQLEYFACSVHDSSRRAIRTTLPTSESDRTPNSRRETHDEIYHGPRRMRVFYLALMCPLCDRSFECSHQF